MREITPRKPKKVEAQKLPDPITVKEATVEEHSAPADDADKLVGTDEKADKLRIVYEEVDVPIEDIIIPEKRLREFRPQIVEVLKESISSQGLKHRIGVSRHPSGKIYLTSGYHRLKSITELGWTLAPCRVKTVYGEDGQISQEPSGLLWDRIDEIEENIFRGDMSTAEKCKNLVEHEKTLKALGLRAEAGGDKGGARTFTTLELAEKIGLGERVYQEYMQIGKNIAPDVMDKIVESPGKLKNNKSELKKIARIEEPEKQDEVVDDLVSGRAKNVEEAVNPSTPSAVDVKNNDYQVAMTAPDTAKTTAETGDKSVASASESASTDEAAKHVTVESRENFDGYPYALVNTHGVPLGVFTDLMNELGSRVYAPVKLLNRNRSDASLYTFFITCGSKCGGREGFLKILEERSEPEYEFKITWVRCE